MVKYKAIQDPVHPRQWTIRERKNRYTYFGVSAGYEFVYFTTLYGKTEDEVKEILRNLECPKTLTYEGTCNG